MIKILPGYFKKNVVEAVVVAEADVLFPLRIIVDEVKYGVAAEVVALTHWVPEATKIFPEVAVKSEIKEPLALVWRREDVTFGIVVVPFSVVEAEMRDCTVVDPKL